MGTIIPGTSYSIIYVFLLIIISVCLSFLYYRKSVLPRRQKYSLTALRFFSVFFILFLFLYPFYKFFTSGKNLNCIIIDNSLSLKIENRDSVLKNIVMNKFPESSGNSDNMYLLFSNSIVGEISEKNIKDINYDSSLNYETNLTKTFESIRQYYNNRKISSITIISDGLINEGGNPSYVASALGIPVNYYLIGDTIQKKDLLIKNVFFNKTCFIDSKTPVNVEINSYNYDKKIKINLFEDEKLIDFKYIDVSKNELSYNVLFNVFSPSVSIKKYKIEIENEPGEITYVNNSKEFFIKYIDNKIKVLVISGGPSPDVAFITEEIKKIKNIESRFLTQKSSVDFYEGKLQDNPDFQCLFLVGFPTDVTSLNTLNILKEIIIKNNASVFFISGSNTQFDKLYTLEDYLPFKSLKQNGNEIETGIRSVIGASDEPNGIFKFPEMLNKLPGIFYPSVDFHVKPNADILLLASANNKPVFTILNFGKLHSAAFFCYDFYKWRLNPVNINSEIFLENLISGTILSLTDKEKTKNLTVETGKQIYGRGEIVTVKCFLNNPEENENLTATLSGKNLIKEIKLQKLNNAEYDGETEITEKDDYYIKAELLKNSISLDNDVQRISVNTNNEEFILTKPDAAILKNLSNLTEGLDFTNKDYKGITAELNKQNDKYINTVQEIKKLYLNTNPYYLIFLFLILSLEWFIRKRENLP